MNNNGKPLLRTFAFALLGTMAALSAEAAAWGPRPTACPVPVPAQTRCYTGDDGAGALYWIAIPQAWNRVLVMHAHGGPETGPPRLERSEADLKRWAVTVKAGYAWAGSTYRRGGYGVTMAAEDTERLRRIFVQRFGPPPARSPCPRARAATPAPTARARSTGSRSRRTGTAACS